MRTTALALFLATLLAACATLESPQREHLASADTATRECAAWFAALDRAIDAQGVRDGGAHRLAGFAYLRADRFSAAFRDEVMDEARLRAWVARLGALDAEARRHETRNLPDAALDELGVDAPETAQARTDSCRDTLMRRDLAAAGTRELIVARAAVPDDYATWQRIAGLYALTRIPFFAGVSRWQREAQAQLLGAPREAADTSARYAPPEPPPSAQQVRDMLAGVARDALGIARPDPAQQRMLFAAHAPTFAVDTAGDYDLPGALHWPTDDATTPAVDTTQPVVYQRLAHTRWGGRIHLQLVYTMWFPERPLVGSFDLLGGRLDGVVWRVTLDEDGSPLIYDSIHPCGCYQMFFPTARVSAKSPPSAGIEWAFVPLTLPQHAAGSRVVVRVASRTHYVSHVLVMDDTAPDVATTYRFASDDELRSLPLPGGGYRSAYRPDGIVAGSERAERFFFWPMGIASAGAMRQWGRHATAFVGRRHFDDADLLERRFELRAR